MYRAVLLMAGFRNDSLLKNPRMTRSIYSGRSATLPMSIAAIKVQDLLHKTVEGLVACGTWQCSVPAHSGVAMNSGRPD